MSTAGPPVHPYFILDKCLGISYRGLAEWLHQTMGVQVWNFDTD